VYCYSTPLSLNEGKREEKVEGLERDNAFVMVGNETKYFGSEGSKAVPIHPSGKYRLHRIKA
jgi:hypothetical protein